MKSELVSVVVPIYNVEEYLPRCLQSIIAQTYSNIEILLVDDGSPDNAGIICDQYALADSRIRVFHISNGGVAKARKFGVERSTGEYIVFVDPDDWLPLNSIETLYSNKCKNVDIVIGNYFNVEGNLVKIQNNFDYSDKTYSPQEYINCLLNMEILGGPWGILFRRKLFTTDSFPNIKRAQDHLMNLIVAIANKNKVTIIETPVYYYVVQSNSSSAKGFKWNYQYSKYYIDIINYNFKRAGLYDHFYYAIMRHSMQRLYVLMVNGNHCSMSDPWVREIYNNTRYKELALTSRFAKLAIKLPILQILFYGITLSRDFIRKVYSQLFFIHNAKSV